MRQKWYIALFFLFVLSFNFNIFGLGQTKEWFATFQQDSSAIVKKTAECGGIIDGYSGPLRSSRREEFGNVMMRNGCDGDFRPYESQYGLQARTVAAIANSFSDFRQVIKVTEVVLTCIFALILTILVRKLYSQLGKVSAIAVATGLLFSPWLAGYSYNLYWVVFTIFLPFIFSMCTYESFKRRRLLIWFYFSLLVLFALKFLNGYEYASTMVLSAFVPIAYYELSRLRLRSLLALWKQAVMVGSVGAVAIVLAITANAAGLRDYAGSWKEAFQMVGSRAEERSNAGLFQANVINSLRVTTPSVYESIDRLYDVDKLEDGKGYPLIYTVLSIINYAMLPAVSLPILMKEPFGTIVQSILAVSVLAGWLLVYLRKRKYQVSILNKLHIMYWLGLIGALSWLVLMPGHAYVHPHINAIIFYLPFLIICYAIVGKYVEYIWNRHGRK